MTTSCYMTIEDKKGQIYKGSSQAKHHEDTIEIFDWSFSVTQTKTGSMQGDNKKSKSLSQPSEFSFSKFYDLSSDDLLSACWQGLKLSKCEIEIYRSFFTMESSNNAPKDKYFLYIVLRQAYITKIQINEEKDEIPKENIQINFEEIEFHYKMWEYTPKGNRQSAGSLSTKYSWQTNQIK